MLETSSKHVVCGGIVANGEFTELYCDPETGDVAYEDPIDGAAILVGEVSVDNPLPIEDLSPVRRDLLENSYDGAIGIILRTTGAIAILPGDFAEERTFDSINKATGKTFPIDTDQQYEFTE